SDVCFSLDGKCGLPNGQPCSTDGQCRSDQCDAGKCVGCKDDADCKQGEVCDSDLLECVTGCRPGATGPLPDGGTVPGACPDGEECVAPEGSSIGECQPTDADAGTGGDPDGGASADDTWGIIEGGGCSCTSTTSSAASPLAILGAVASALLLVRRRSKRGSESRQFPSDRA